MASLYLHHIAIVVHDLDRSKAFYEQVLALKEISRLTEGQSNHPGAWYALGEQELHLQTRPDRLPKTDQHFALVTEGFDALMKRAVESGARTEKGRPIEGFSRRGFLYDPDGNRIEILQRG